MKCSAVGANLCARDPKEVKGMMIRGLCTAADKEESIVHSKNIISQQ
jgi:hypothetical protein